MQYFKQFFTLSFPTLFLMVFWAVLKFHYFFLYIYNILCYFKMPIVLFGCFCCALNVFPMLSVPYLFTDSMVIVVIHTYILPRVPDPRATHRRPLHIPLFSTCPCKGTELTSLTELISHL